MRLNQTSMPILSVYIFFFTITIRSLYFTSLAHSLALVRFLQFTTANHESRTMINRAVTQLMNKRLTRARLKYIDRFMVDFFFHKETTGWLWRYWSIVFSIVNFIWCPYNKINEDSKQQFIYRTRFFF